MIHQPIKLPPPSRHPMAQPAPDGWLRDLVLHARTPAVRDRLDVAIYVAAVRLRRMEKHHRDEADALLETYRTALGLQ